MQRSIVAPLHLLGWLIFFSMPALFIASNQGTQAILQLAGWVYFSVYIVIFYLHTNILFPKLYRRKRYILYALSFLALATLVTILRPFDRLNHSSGTPVFHTSSPPRSLAECDSVTATAVTDIRKASGSSNGISRAPKFDIISLALFLLVMALSIAVIFIRRWRTAVEATARAEADKIAAELAMLKAQVNPHFLFNTLNNIYAQAVTNDENTAASVMKLSNIMRYMIEDVTEPFVPLSDEVNFITDYIELQRLRVGSKVRLDFSVNGTVHDKRIAPLMLVTLVENVFKYGTSNKEESLLTIRLETDEKIIRFYTRNKLYPRAGTQGTRMGIANTKKRLEHLYPGKHTLLITEVDGHFAIDLSMQLN